MKSPAPFLLLSLLSLLAPLATASAATVALDDERESLQAMLERVRRERDAALAKIQSGVDEAVVELELLSENPIERRVIAARKVLLDMGQDCAPLLVRHIDPGADADESIEFRAEQVTLVLRELASPAVTDAVLAVLETGTRAGRRHALQVLATSPEPARVAPELRDFYRSSSGSLRRDALLAVAQLGGPEAQAIVAEALADDDDDLVGVALEAMAKAGGETGAPHVLALVRDDRGTNHVERILDFYFAVPSALAEDHVLALIELAKHSEIGRKDIHRILDGLRQLDAPLSNSIEKAMEPLVEHPNETVSEDALVLLARAKDKAARRRLLQKYDDRVKRQKDYDKAYVERAEILYRIGDYSKAIKDYQDAIEIQKDKTLQAEPFIGAARCYALLKRYKDAAEYLDDAPVSLVTLRELAKDPDFALMVESKHRRCFHLPDE